jgi:hypothetical protein
MQYETGNKNCFKSQVRLISGYRASGVYNATRAKSLEVMDVEELLKKSAVTVPTFAICIKSRSKNERSV